MINSLIRKNLRNFEAYTSARSLYQKGLLMDANENSLGSVVSLNLTKDLNRYPDPKSTLLRKSLGKFLNVKEKNIFVGNGSDEIIDLLIRLFVEPGEEIVTIEPTYGMYKVAAATAGVAVKNCLLAKDFTIDVANLLSKITKRSKVIFLCSPNNPTGTLIEPSDVKFICKNFKGLVVVDEAYVEFASRASLVKNVLSLENLVVLRTFSKAWGLAGIRVGYAVGNEVLIDYLMKIKLPYNVNRLSAQIAANALNQSQKMLRWKRKIVRERARLARGLQKIGIKVFPSEANFLLVSYPEASVLAKRLAEEFGIIIRDLSSKPMLRDCVRISVGTPAQNDLLLKALKKIL
ncbi:MAG: histidinol-phosphate transaminase [bacterium]|nr:histidinol-phosphate transaminase [bacterium]